MEFNTPTVVTIGDINIDWIINIEDINKPIHSLWLEAKDCISFRLGGSGSIFAIGAKNAGFRSCLIGKVGNDPFGSFGKEYLEQKGINLLLSIDTQMDTGKVIILRDTNDKKAMISHRGANVNLRPDEIDRQVIENCDLLFISGYTLLEAPQSEASLEAVQIAKSKGIFVILDVVPHRVFAGDLSKDYYRCLSLVDSVVLELGTARRMLNNYNDSETNIIKSLLNLYKLVILRPNNDTQIIASQSHTKSMSTGYSQTPNKVGYLDKITAQVLFDYCVKDKGI
jgi:sugar/nucleoside kinase (ribokinase family)